MKRIPKISWVIFALLVLIQDSNCCLSHINDGLSRMLNSSPFGTKSSTPRFSGISAKKYTSEYTRINAPGQRFTATHGISAKKGEQKLFLFVVDELNVNYMAVSSNIAIEGSRGGPENYELYMKYGSPPTSRDYDLKSTLTASDSYVGDVLYSRDITVPRPPLGEYYFLLEAKKDFGELLVTAIMDTPPDARAAFTIRRMGHFVR